MENISRRAFTQKATVALAAVGTLAVSAPKAVSADQADAQYPVVLYRETNAWKKYYETLK